MMQSTTGFAGLTMPVFNAFGWTGEETAIKFALSQLEEFIHALHSALSRDAQEALPSYGLSEADQNVYLAASDDIENDIYVTFNARPLNLEIQLSLRGKELLRKGLKNAEDDHIRCHRLITELGPEWTLRIQQMELDEEAGDAMHYQDLFKDVISALDEDTALELFRKAAYLNSELKWLTPVYLSRRVGSEQAASMGIQIVDVMSEQVNRLLPLIYFLTGRTAKKAAKPKAKPKAVQVAEVEPVAVVEEIDPEEGFTYVAELKPLHIRRGFINLTPDHWPFFAENSRSTTREVTIYYDGIYDKDSSVWCLLPNGQARVVLSPAVQKWLEDYFSPTDRIAVVARRMGDEDIQLSLKPAG